MNDVSHRYWMEMALEEAGKGLFTTAPNPRVGCVIVKKNQLLSTGYHQRYGDRHAEALALKKCHAEQLAGSTVYVNLEPCSHIGKNPPCAQALINAGISKAFIANLDPNPLVSGQGINQLKQAGIQTVVGLCEKQGQQLNCGFLKRMQKGLPWVRVKMAQSLDGRTAMDNGDSYWITGEQARADVQHWRARSQAIVTGVETVLQDDCSLTVRPEQLKTDYNHDFDQFQPLRVIMDSQLRIPLTAKILSRPDSVVIATLVGGEQTKIQALQEQGVKVLSLPAYKRRPDIVKLLVWLGKQQINEVLVESGATLAGAFIKQKLVDQLIIYIAPVLMGASAKPLFNFNIEHMQDRLHIGQYEIKSLGRDWRIIAHFPE